MKTSTYSLIKSPCPREGEVELVVHTVEGGQRWLEHIMDQTRLGMAAIEEFLGEPWPSDVYTVTFLPDGGRSSGWPHGMLLNNPTHTVIHHELGHAYFRTLHFPDWLAEGGAEFLQVYVFGIYSDKGIEGEIEEEYEFWHGGCLDKGITNIHETNESGYVEGSPYGSVFGFANEYCEYTTGMVFLSRLYLSLGHEMVSSSLRALYQAGPGNPDGIQRRVLDEEIYYILLENTPPEKQDEFRDLYRCFHGGPMPDSDPNPGPNASSCRPEWTPEPTPVPTLTSMPISAALAPLGDNLLWAFTNFMPPWSVYDPSGAFSLDQISSLMPRLSPPDESEIAPLTNLKTGWIYFLSVEQDQTVQLNGNTFILKEGVNVIGWK